MPVKSEIKLGFFVGIGVAIALMFLGFLQVLTLRAVHRAG